MIEQIKKEMRNKFMSELLVFGHKSPDTDSIMSALVMADLENFLGKDTATPYRLGEVNKETAYALNYIHAEAPKLLEKINENDKVILVDHNEFPQSIDGIEKAKIIKVIDHHRICDFHTAEPLFYMAEPVGCTSTILFEMYTINQIEIKPNIAFFMLSAILSDTLLLKSPTTTIKDIKAVETLAKIANIPYQTYGLELLKAGTDLSGYSPKELMNIDVKLVDMNGKKVKIAQVNTVDIEDVLKNQNHLETSMQETIQEENLDLFMFVITDIVNSNSKAIVLGNQSSLVEKAYHLQLENHLAFLPGVVSRKKQIVPILQENA